MYRRVLSFPISTWECDVTSYSRCRVNIFLLLGFNRHRPLHQFQVHNITLLYFIRFNFLRNCQTAFQGGFHKYMQINIYVYVYIDIKYINLYLNVCQVCVCACILLCRRIHIKLLITPASTRYHQGFEFSLEF